MILWVEWQQILVILIWLKLYLKQKLTVRAPGTKLMDGCKLKIKQTQGGDKGFITSYRQILSEQQKMN